MQTNKILVVFPDGVGIRNYLYSKVFDDLDQQLVLFHNFDADTISYLKTFKKIDQDVVIPKYSESVREKFLRELICLLRLQFNARKTNNETLLTNWNKNHKKLSNRLFYKAVETAAFLFKDYNAILKLETAYQKAIRKNIFYNQIASILQTIKPERVFCSHQRGLKMATIFAAAKDLGIPSATVIFSWDNLPKARLAIRADKYLVWSEHMKKEMQLFYPEIPASDVIVTGSPQFEFYAEPANLIGRAMFFERYELDPAKKIICFSGDDEKTSPDDPMYLRDVAQAITDAGLINVYQILFRRCPVDFSNRFESVLAEFSELIKVADPIWHVAESGGFSTIYPEFDDVKLLASTAYHADAVINLGSTMAFDFAMYDKPCLYINYNQTTDSKAWIPVEAIYSLQHFKSMPDKRAVFWINGKNEILDTIKRAIDSTKNPYMKSWESKVLGDYKNASKNISAILKGQFTEAAIK